MTNKQIIIDGVDVSGCEKKGETINGITCGNGERIRLANEIITKHKLCKDNPNCHYKKYKRKEQECEELKKQVDDLLHKPEIQDKIIWKIDNEALLGSKDAYIYKLEKTLTEIKNKLTVHKTLYYESKLIEKLHKQILQKISEVLND